MAGAVEPRLGIRFGRVGDEGIPMVYVAGHHRSERLRTRHADVTFLSRLYHTAGGREAAFYKGASPSGAGPDRKANSQERLSWSYVALFGGSSLGAATDLSRH